VDGKISGDSDSKGNGELTGNVSASGLKLDFEARTIAATGSAPDLYFKVNGLQGLGPLVGSYLGAFDPSESKHVTDALNGVNNQWYFVDHTLLDGALSSNASGGDTSISKKDITDFLNALGTPTKKYIFTSDTNNMAVVVKQNIGREKVDGVSTYHYKVAINKDNLKKWNKEACDQLKNNKLYKMINLDKDQAALEKECYDTSDIDSLDSSITADAWVDTHTKLVHKVRFYPDSKNNSNLYFDLIQNYQGGSKIPFTFGFNDKQGGEASTGALNAEYDSSTSTLKITGNLKLSGDDTNGSGTLSLNISPNNTAVKVDKPTNAKNILQLVNDLGLSSLTTDNSFPDDTSPTILQ
jgi:hypothetical protein